MSPAAAREGVPAASVLDRVRRGLPDLTRAERRIARTVIAGYPVSGLGTVADLAASSATSSASVVRLVQKLGFDGYSQFQLAVREELATRASGPAHRIEQADSSWTEPGTLARAAAAATRTIASIPTTIPESEFEAAVDLLCDPGRSIGLVGGRVTGLLGAYLQHHLSRARRQVGVFPLDGRDRYSALLDVGRRDVLVVLDVRRYDPDVASLASAVAGRGATVVLLTDLLMSPIASVAQVVLPVRVDAPSPFDTTVALLVLVEALATAAVARLGDPAATRMRGWDALADVPPRTPPG
jgi:DNA-binding MurR/RpiR family transcriptional regulator